MTALAENNVERLPVPLRLDGSLTRMLIEGNAPNEWKLKTHASREDILSPNWFGPADHMLAVNDDIKVYYGPHPFDCDLMIQGRYRGGAKPHARLFLTVVGKDPVIDELTGQVARYKITVKEA
ncbi:MAG: hypothetical protein ACFCVH_13870 [Alphaproteobacteria bacterium]